LRELIKNEKIEELLNKSREDRDDEYLNNSLHK